MGGNLRKICDFGGKKKKKNVLSLFLSCVRCSLPAARVGRPSRTEGSQEGLEEQPVVVIWDVTWCCRGGGEDGGTGGLERQERRDAAGEGKWLEHSAP